MRNERTALKTFGEYCGTALIALGLFAMCIAQAEKEAELEAMTRPEPIEPIIKPVIEVEPVETPVEVLAEVEISPVTDFYVEVDEVVVEEVKSDTAQINEECEKTYTDWDLELLALVIYQEAGADYISDETRLMVGNVVLNRVADSRYPDTIEEVLLQPRQYGRLSWTGIKWPDRVTDPYEAHAVERAYRLAQELLEGKRVLPEDVIFQAEFSQGTETVAYQDGMYFCR